MAVHPILIARAAQTITMKFDWRPSGRYPHVPADAQKETLNLGKLAVKVRWRFLRDDDVAAARSRRALFAIASEDFHCRIYRADFPPHVRVG